MGRCCLDGPMAKSAILSARQGSSIFRGDDPPYPLMSALAHGRLVRGRTPVPPMSALAHGRPVRGRTSVPPMSALARGRPVRRPPYPGMSALAHGRAV